MHSRMGKREFDKRRPSPRPGRQGTRSRRRRARSDARRVGGHHHAWLLRLRRQVGGLRRERGPPSKRKVLLTPDRGTPVADAGDGVTASPKVVPFAMTLLSSSASRLQRLCRSSAPKRGLARTQAAGDRPGLGSRCRSSWHRRQCLPRAWHLARGLQSCHTEGLLFAASIAIADRCRRISGDQDASAI